MTAERRAHQIGRREVDLWREAQIAKYETLTRALDALVVNWHQREQQYRHVRPHDAATAETLHGCANELVLELAKYREPR